VDTHFREAIADLKNKLKSNYSPIKAPFLPQRSEGAKSPSFTKIYTFKNLSLWFSEPFCLRYAVAMFFFFISFLDDSQ